MMTYKLTSDVALAKVFPKVTNRNSLESGAKANIISGSNARVIELVNGDVLKVRNHYVAAIEML